MKHINQHENILKEFVEKHPRILCEMGYNVQEMRNFWIRKLSKYKNPIKIYAFMLRNNLIPPNEITEANKHIAELNGLTSDIGDNQVLAYNGFGDAMHERLFIKNNPDDFLYWKFMNEYKMVYTLFVEYYPLKDDAVHILAEMLDKSQWRPEWLEGSLNEMFNRNEKKRAEFRERLTGLGISLPRYLSSLNA